jgi:uncharacterized membrane protein YdfJ with MMPL/SSD domain
MVVVTGALPCALATTSSWLAPGCSGTDVVKTPEPTCADCPATCTVALSGVTVPLTVTRSADVELPSAGASTWTCTDVLEEPHPEIASVTRTPVAIHATAATLVGDSPFMPPFSARQPPNLKSAGQTMRRIGRWSTRRPWRAIATWLAFVAVALGALALTDGTKRPTIDQDAARLHSLNEPA